MQRTITLAVVAMALLAVAPLSIAETKTASYDIPSGPNPDLCGKGVTCGIATRPCAVEWDDWDEGIFSDSGDETVFGPAGFTAEDNPDDTVGKTALTPAVTTTCKSGRDALGRGDDGVLRMGVYSAALRSDCGDCYFDFQVTVTDTLPSHTYYVFCVITQYQDGRQGSDNTCGELSDCTTGVDPADCDDIPDPRVAGCTPASLTSPVLSGGEVNRPVAFVFATFVDQTTGGVCLGSSGSVSVTMS